MPDRSVSLSPEEYRAAQRAFAADASALKDADLSRGGVALAFEIVPLPGLPGSPQARAKIAEDRSGDGTVVKLVVHVEEICLDDMARITPAMQDFVVRVLHPLPRDIVVDAGESPVFRHQWDFIVWGVPALRLPGVKAELIRTMLVAARDAASARLPW